jgi:hypothetical protein
MLSMKASISASPRKVIASACTPLGGAPSNDTSMHVPRALHQSLGCSWHGQTFHCNRRADAITAAGVQYSPARMDAPNGTVRPDVFDHVVRTRQTEGTDYSVPITTLRRGVLRCITFR